MQETQDNKLTEMAIHKELDLIQGCISRMGHNSFLVKGWALTLFTFFIGFTQKRQCKYFGFRCIPRCDNCILDT